jgi:hypothetical protein
MVDVLQGADVGSKVVPLVGWRDALIKGDGNVE